MSKWEGQFDVEKAISYINSFKNNKQSAA